jgi:hypothetical protein
MGQQDRLLLVYDENEEGFVGRRQIQKASERVAVKGTKQLAEQLQKLILAGATFSRALFFTHGASGEIHFDRGTSILSIHNFEDVLDRQDYDRLFPEYSRIYFDGCNVAAGQEGWSFLTLVGKKFLRQKGGLTSGFIGKGVGLWWFGIVHTPIPMLNPDEGERHVFFGPGGEVMAWEDEIGAHLSVGPGVKPLPHGTLRVSVPPLQYDAVLLPILERHIRFDDVHSQFARVKLLERFFGALESADARALLARLELHTSDRLSRAFSYYLSSPTRIRLLGILRDRV